MEAFGGKVYRNAEKITPRGDIVPVTSKEVSGMELNAEGKVDMDLLRSRSKSLARDINTASKLGKGDEEIGLISLKRGNNNPLYGPTVQGVDDTIAKVASDVGDTEYLAAKKSFSDFRGLIEQAKSQGIDFSNPLSIQAVMKSGVTHSPLLQQAVKAVDDYQGTKLGTQMAMWKSAYTAQNMNPNFLRFGMVLGLTGLAALKSESLPGRIGYVAGGLTLGTPWGMSKLMLGVENRGLTSGITKTAGKVANSALLRRLVTQSAAQKAAKSISK
jgi:hypothetical protein